MQKNNHKFLIYIALLLLLVSGVSAANILDSVFQPFSGLNFGNFYLRYYGFIDAIVYFILFMSLAQFVFMKVYKNDAQTENKFKEAKLIAVAVGLALTVGMSVMELRTGFNLGGLYPIALIVILIMLAMLLYNLLLGLFPPEDGSKFGMVSAALTYLIIYALMLVPFNALTTWMNTSAPMLSAIFAIASIIAFIYLLIKLFGVFNNGKTTTPVPGPQGPPGPPGKDAPIPEVKPEEKPLTPASNQVVTWLESELPLLEQAAKAYSEKGRELIGSHKNNQDTGTDWNEFYRREKSVIDIIGSFNTMLNPLVNKQDTLSEDDLGRLLKIFYETGNISAKMLQFHNQLVDAYNNKEDAPSDPF